VRTVYSIGYTQKSLERFIRLIQGVGVDAVVDVRLRNTSQLAGFSKRNDLSFLLREGFGIEYEHHPELAPTDAILDGYKAGGGWPAYEAAFLRLMAEHDAAAVGAEILGRYQRPCLLCAEPAADRCHRRLVAEWWARELPDVEIAHL
jgi:uncharacterized protein (DUF488 family)